MGKVPAGLEGYYREIAAALPCSGRRKQKYLSDLRERLCMLENEVPVANYEAAQMYIGPVEEIVESWKDNLSVDDLSCRIRFKRRTKVLLTAAALVAVTILMLLGGFYIKYQDSAHGDFVVDEIIVTKPDDMSESDYKQYWKQQLDEYWGK